MLSNATAAFPRVRETDSCCIATLKFFVKTFHILVNIMETVTQNFKNQIYNSVDDRVEQEEKSQLLNFI